ncbi:MAG: Hsp70 family protein [Selenomonadaceae bacterium]|nr:Hsp70 family protein [Selenomonadaceae bacterium]
MGVAVGLDFGTTNTVVTYEDKNGKLKPYKVNGSPLVPSAIYFKSRDDYIIGQKALNMGVQNFAALVTKFKTRLNEDNTPYDVILEDGSSFRLQPRVAVKYFLNKLLGEVQEYLMKKKIGDAIIDRAVITVPTKFNDRANKEIKKAAAAAMGLQVSQIKLVYEPTAAAVAAQQDDDNNDTRLLIYDFGGGTFDVSLIQKDKEVFKQIKTDGDPKCGGNLLTDILAKNLLTWANEEYGTNFPFDIEGFDEDDYGISEQNYLANRDKIIKAANDAKISLSEDSETAVDFQFWISDSANKPYGVDVSRKDFENMIREKINQTAEITRRVVDSDEAKAIGGIDKIIIAGGSGQIPLIRDVLQDKLGNLSISRSDDVSTLISRGAAILAKNIDAIEKVTAQKTTVQLGISSTVGMSYGNFQTIIEEGLDLPCENSCDFRLMKDNQERLKISYYERDIKNYPDAKIIDDEGITPVDELLVELPPDLKKADTIVRVTFVVQKDSSLELSAKVLNNDGQTVSAEKIEVNKVSDLF